MSINCIERICLVLWLNCPSQTQSDVEVQTDLGKLTDRQTVWQTDWLTDWLTVHQLLGLSSNGGASNGVCDWTLLGIGKRDWTLDATWTANISIRFPAISIQTPHTHRYTDTYRENDLHMSWPKNKGTQLAHTFAPSQTHTFTYMATISASARLTLAKADKTRARKNK